MDLRSLSSIDRRKAIENELGLDLSALSIDPKKLGDADQKNCENMFGHVPIPIGYAGPLPVTFSSGESIDIHLPLATTEGALVASVNRGCKAIREAGSVVVQSIYHGITRSLAFKLTKNTQQTCHAEVLRSRPSRLGYASHLRMTQSGNGASKHHQKIIDDIHQKQHEWKVIGETTSKHLKILKYDIDTDGPYLFLTIYADTDEAMGMNMVTIAAQKIGEWMEKNMNVPAGRSSQSEGWEFITVAANVDSDKKPSQRTHDKGRGYEVTATATIPLDVISTILKTTPGAMLEVATAKLDSGSKIAGAIGSNLHAANIIAALYLATGQDAAHVVEGSLTDTAVSEIRNPTRLGEGRSRSRKSEIRITIRIPAVLVGVQGGGTELPAQKQCLDMLLKTEHCTLKTTQRLAESIGAAVLAGELSLLAALSSHHLAKSHKILAR